MEPTSRTRWPLGLFGMIGLVVVVETWLAYQPLRFLETASLSWRMGFDAVPREAERCDVACLGDSLVKIGVIPELVSLGSGRTAYNFAMAQAPAPATYFMLRRLIEAGGKPSAIVVDFKANILAGGPKFSLRHWQTVASPREAFELAAESRSPALFCEIALGRILPSYRDRNEVREALLASLSGDLARNRETNRIAWRNWTRNLGAHVNSPSLQFHGDVDAETHKKLLSNGWKCHRINATYVEKFLKLAEAEQIHVYWLIPPMHPQVQARREQSGVDAAFGQFVRSNHAKHPSMTVIDGRHSGYESWTFADASHLNGLGSVSMSRDLATILAQPSPAERWVALPGSSPGLRQFRSRTSNLPAPRSLWRQLGGEFQPVEPSLSLRPASNSRARRSRVA